MIKYKIFTTEWSSWWPSRPYIVIDHSSINNYDEDMFLNEEINNLSWRYVREIVQELEEVIAWTKIGTSFWYETTSIDIYKKWYNLWKDCKYPDNYNEDTLITDIKIEEILKMMTEWRDYINDWEKETGKIKN